jgi:acetate kinase
LFVPAHADQRRKSKGERVKRMSKSLQGRLAELQLIAKSGARVVYGGNGFVSPNRWVSNAIIKDFLERGYLEQRDNQVTVTKKGFAVLNEKGQPSE